MITIKEDEDAEKRDDSCVVRVLGSDSVNVLAMSFTGPVGTFIWSIRSVIVPLNSVDNEEDSGSKGRKGEKTTHGENRHSVVHLMISSFHFILVYFLKKKYFFFGA